MNSYNWLFWRQNIFKLKVENWQLKVKTGIFDWRAECKKELLNGRFKKCRNSDFYDEENFSKSFLEIRLDLLLSADG